MVAVHPSRGHGRRCVVSHLERPVEAAAVAVWLEGFDCKGRRWRHGHHGESDEYAPGETTRSTCPHALPFGDSRWGVAVAHLIDHRFRPFRSLVPLVVRHRGSARMTSRLLACPVVALASGTMRWHVPAEVRGRMARPPIEGVIDRRLLVNYRVDPDVASKLVPPPFRAKVVNGYAVAGICLLRMTELRPRPFPRWVGLRSENAAHRVAVEWEDENGTTSGVYIPRRDSASIANVIVGGRVYPGVHHRARFEVRESDREIGVRFASYDRSTEVDVEVEVVEHLSGSHLFADLAEASSFFERGSVGYSATSDPSRFDGLELRTNAWSMVPARVVRARSSFFEDETHVPKGGAALDSALLMREVPVTWSPRSPLRVAGSRIRP